MSFFQGLNIRQKFATLGLGIVGIAGLGAVGAHAISDPQSTKPGSQQSKQRKVAPGSIKAGPNSKTSATYRPAYGSININTAGAEELDQLPGVGPSTAKKIIDYRTQHGNFKSVDELDNVKGIEPKKLD